MSYLQSLINFQQYLLTSGSLLFTNQEIHQGNNQIGEANKDNKSASEQKTKAKRYHQGALNSIVLSLRCLLKLMESGSVQQPDSTGWSSLDLIAKTKLVLQQMLSIIYNKIKMLKLKMSLQKAKEKNEVRLNKIHHCKTQAFLISLIADQLDVLEAPSNDPRLQMKQNMQPS